MPDKIEIPPQFLADLKARAEKATPGPWVEFGLESGNGNSSCTVGTEKPGLDICRLDSQLYCKNCLCNVAYIAAANPQTILELIADYERLEKENEELRANNYGPEILNDPAALTVSYFAGRMAEGRERNAKEDKLLDEKERLEKEADWLAAQILCCSDDNRIDTCNYVECASWCIGATIESWRKAAREAVEKENEAHKSAD